MNWEEKWAALLALAPGDVKMRRPGSWYAAIRAEQKMKDGFLYGDYGNGPTPEQAVQDAWNVYTKGVQVIYSNTGKREEYIWNGWRWVDMTEPTTENEAEKT